MIYDFREPQRFNPIGTILSCIFTKAQTLLLKAECAFLRISSKKNIVSMLKNLKKILIVIIISLISVNVHSQTYSYCMGDVVGLIANPFSGNLQWQQSTDSINWSDIPDATSPSLAIVFWSNKFYRAKITNSGCLPSYSAVKQIIENTLGCPPPSFPVGSITCNGSTPIIPVTNPITGRIWMDRNLGAINVATSSTSTSSYGDLYQWGRRSDGHQCRTSVSTEVISSVDQPGGSLYIMCNGLNITNDWRNPQNSNLWQGVGGVNNPCPTGYRLPTGAEFSAEASTWISLNTNGAFSSVLKLTAGGMRGYTDGSGDPLLQEGVQGLYWTSSTFLDNLNNFSRSDYFLFTSTQASLRTGTSGGSRAQGMSVRCIKE